MKPIPSPHKRSHLIRNGATLDKGRMMAMEAQEWMEESEEAFYSILTYLRALKERGVRGRVRDRVALFCIDNGIKLGSGSRSFANSKWAAMERYIALADPSLVGTVIEMNDSYIDCYGLLPVSWMENVRAENAPY